MRRDDQEEHQNRYVATWYMALGSWAGMPRRAGSVGEGGRRGGAQHFRAAVECGRQWAFTRCRPEAACSIQARQTIEQAAEGRTHSADGSKHAQTSRATRKGCPGARLAGGCRWQDGQQNGQLEPGGKTRTAAQQHWRLRHGSFWRLSLLLRALSAPAAGHKVGVRPIMQRTRRKMRGQRDAIVESSSVQAHRADVVQCAALIARTRAPLGARCGLQRASGRGGLARAP